MIKQKAVALLAIRECSRFILRQKLKERFDEEGDAELIEACLDELQERNYLSDSRFARASVISKASRAGDQKLKWELRQKGVSDEDIAEAMESLETSEYERAKALWDRKFGELPSDRKERDRQIRFLASRGFTFKTISQIFRGDLDDF